MNQAELLHVRRRELRAGFERVDRLVLGAVVLEHAAQIGQQRDEEDVADEDGDPDDPSTITKSSVDSTGSQLVRSAGRS